MTARTDRRRAPARAARRRGRPAEAAEAITFPTPLGRMTVVARGGALVEARLGGGARAGEVEAETPVLAEARAQLQAWFDGCRRELDLPIAPAGTPFQRAVWAALRRIPRGEVRSYAEVARAVGRPAAVRAVGAANARNPLAVIVPCHRVIGSDGSLTGYAHGLPAKRWLLAHEGAGAG